MASFAGMCTPSRLAAVLLVLSIANLLQAAPPATQPATQPAPELSVRFVSIAKTEKGYKLTVELTNVSGKDIEAIRGGIRFYQGDNQIGKSGAAIDDMPAMRAGEKIQRSGAWTGLDLRVFESLQTAPDSVNIVWHSYSVTFAGGK